MHQKVEERIENYVRQHLSPTEDEREMIADRYGVLDRMLDGETFQSGSYARFTSLTPVNDLDVIWELPASLIEQVQGRTAMFKSVNPYELDMRRVLADLARRLENESRKRAVYLRIKVQSHSVGIYFGETDEEFSIDLVPAIPNGEANEFGDALYIVPEVALVRRAGRKALYESLAPITWLKSDPRGYKVASEILNAQTANFRKTAKIIKAWKRACKRRNDTFPLKSFHLEIMTQGVLSRNPALSCVKALDSVFCLMPDCLESPCYPDRADSRRYIDSYVGEFNESTRRLVRAEVFDAKALVSQLQVEADADKAELVLRRLIGKAPTVQTSRVLTVPAVSRPYHAGK